MKNTISGIENGPLVLESEVSLLIEDGKSIVFKSPTYLCRCGASKNKPFCDGEYQKKGFLSKKDISKELVYEYSGKKINITFNRSICAGAGKCVSGLPTVFVSGGSKDWIHPDNDTLENIITTINSCPSGALAYSINGEKQLDSRSTPKVTVVKNGPYRVEAVHPSSLPIPTNFSTTKYTLCRCGYSKNKPYCDYSHATKEWTDE